MSMEPFAPRVGATKRITVAASTGRVKVAEGLPGSYVSVLVDNNGTARTWIKPGDVTVTAAVTDLGIGAGVVQILRFRIPDTGELYIAAIAAGSTGDIEFTPGSGI